MKIHSDWCARVWGSDCPLHANGKHYCLEEIKNHPPKHKCICGKEQ